MRRLMGSFLISGLLALLAAPAHATLIDRGSGLIYDDVLDITWLQDAGFGGNRNWDDAVVWADTLSFGGFDDWRLPSISVAGGLPIGSSLAPVDCSTHWFVYFAVESCDGSVETIKANGGEVHSGPFDTPVGRMAVVADPTGATFGVIKMNQQ